MAARKLAAPANAVAFTVKRTNVQDRRSSLTVPQAMHFDDVSRSIKVFCADGYTRECRVDRLSDIKLGRQMFVDLEKAIKNKTEIRFFAAGGFDPNKWFYKFEEGTKAGKDGLPF